MLQNRYLVIKKLGEGGMGAVYLAEDTSLFGKKCIVKEMLPYYTNEQERQEAEKFFLREVQLLAQLKHAGIPQILTILLWLTITTM
jgi:serine/threonine protein kinase